MFKGSFKGFMKGFKGLSRFLLQSSSKGSVKEFCRGSSLRGPESPRESPRR